MSELQLIVRIQAQLYHINNCCKRSFSNHLTVKHTYGTEGDKSVLPGVDVAVIGPVSPHVRGAVDQPGGV